MSVLVRTFNLTGIDVEKIEDGWRHRCFPFVHLSTILTILYCSRVPAAVLAVTVRGHELHPDDVGDPVAALVQQQGSHPKCRRLEDRDPGPQSRPGSKFLRP